MSKSEKSEEYVPALGDKVTFHMPSGEERVDVLGFVVEVGSDRGTLLAVLTPYALTWKRSDPGTGTGHFELVAARGVTGA